MNELARLQAFVAEGLKRFEFGLRRKVEGDASAAALSGTDDVPTEFKALVEQVLPVAGAVGAVTANAFRAVLAAARVAAALPQVLDGGRGGGTVRWRRFGFGPRFVPARFPDADTFGHGFVFCRGVFRSDRREAGGTGWSTDYPDAELNFSIRLSELTKTRVTRGADGKPVHVTVRLTDDALFKCPYLHMEDVGTMALSDDEVLKLREYLLKGGFLWVDDYWGEYAWDQWVEQIGRVLPPAEFPIADLPLEHPIWQSQFQLKELPQIPAIQQWRRLSLRHLRARRGEPHAALPRHRRQRAAACSW